MTKTTNIHAKSNAIIAAALPRETKDAKPLRFVMKRNADGGVYLARAN